MLKKIAVTLGTAAIAATLIASPAAADEQTASESSPSTGVVSATCGDALHALGKQQTKGLAKPAALKTAHHACDNPDAAKNGAVFATVTVGKRTIGGVFARPEQSALILPNQWDVTSVLLNGHNVAKYETSDKFSMLRKKGTININGHDYPATVSAQLGDGGSTIKVALADDALGVWPAQNQAMPAEGTPVVVFGEKGPSQVNVGPTYMDKWKSLGSKVTGTVTTPDGLLIGYSGQFGTGYDSNAEFKFWKNRTWLQDAIAGS